jgi:hypothetical protein
LHDEIDHKKLSCVLGLLEHQDPASIMADNQRLLLFIWLRRMEIQLAGNFPFENIALEIKITAQ